MATNPEIVKIKEGIVWTVATNVTSGVINFQRSNKPDMVFLCTYRLTGQSAPDLATVQAEGFNIFKDEKQAQIESDAAIDIYMICGNGDAKTSDWGEVVIWV